MKHLLCLIVLLLVLLPVTVVGEGLPTELQTKIEIAMKLWEVDRKEYIRLTKLSDTEKQALLSAFKKENDREKSKSIALLLALNCVSVDEKRTSFLDLYQYRCKNGHFDLIARNAVISFDNLYQLSFAKSADRPKSIQFLRRYIKFFKDEGRRSGGFSPGESDLEYLEEIEKFLEDGGF